MRTSETRVPHECSDNGWQEKHMSPSPFPRRPLPPITDVVRAYFDARVERIPFDTCWHWTGTLSQRGQYGLLNVPPLSQYRAHRVAWEIYRGPLPADTRSIDHLCRVSDCVNPDHLEVVTQKTNVLRGVGPTAENARKASCLRGHPFTPANTWVFTGKDGYTRRACRECQRMHSRESARIHKPWIRQNARRRAARYAKEESAE